MSEIDIEFAEFAKEILAGFMERVEMVATIYGEDKSLRGLLS